MEKFVNDVEAADILSIKVQTLRNWRHLRKGPPYHKIHRTVRYSLDDLNKFMEDRRIDPSSN